MKNMSSSDAWWHGTHIDPVDTSCWSQRVKGATYRLKEAFAENLMLNRKSFMSLLSI
jgi:hypothetical protein